MYKKSIQYANTVASQDKNQIIMHMNGDVKSKWLSLPWLEALIVVTPQG